MLSFNYIDEHLIQGRSQKFFKWGDFQIFCMNKFRSENFKEIKNPSKLKKIFQ